MTENNYQYVLKLAIFWRDTCATKESKKTFLLYFQGQIAMAWSGIKLYQVIQWKLNTANALSKFSPSYIPHGEKQHCLSECKTQPSKRRGFSGEELLQWHSGELQHLFTVSAGTAFWKCLAIFTAAASQQKFLERIYSSKAIWPSSRWTVRKDVRWKMVQGLKFVDL